MISKKPIFKKEIHVVSAVLAVSALIYTVYAVNSRQNVAPTNLKAAACKTDECSTATGCQLPGYLLEGFKCVRSNQWEASDGAIVPGGPEGPLPTAVPAADSNQAIAKRVLDWIDTQRDSSGAYGFKGSCEKGQEQSCDSPPREDPTAAFSVIWARYKYFQKSGDQNEFSKIVRDIDTFYVLHSQPEYRNLRQSTQWICKILYDIGHDDAFINQRQKLEYLCQNTWYAGAAMEEIRKKVQTKEVVPEPEVDSVNQGAIVAYDAVTDTDRYLHGFYWYAVSASNLLSQYQWFNDNSLLSQAKLVYRNALQVYSNKKNDSEFFKRGDAVIAVAALDFYKVTNQKKYLDFAVNYINKRHNQPITNMSDAGIYLYLLDEIYSVTQDPQYLTLISNIISNLLNDAFNSNMGSFREFSQSLDRFDVRTNSIIAGVLLNH